MDSKRFISALRDYLLPVLLPGALIAGLLLLVLLLPPWESSSSLPDMLLNLIDAALVVALILVFSLSLRYFRARGFYFLVLLCVQMWYLQAPGAAGPGAFWAMIFVPYGFLLFLLFSERGIFSPRTRLILLGILLPVGLRFALERYAGLDLTSGFVPGPFADTLSVYAPGLSFWTLLLYGLALMAVIIRYLVKPGRDSASALWMLVISALMTMAASGNREDIIAALMVDGQGSGGEYLFLAPPGVDPAAHALLALFVFGAALLQILTLFDVSYRMAYQDQLTELPGRRAFDDAMKNLGKRYAIAMLDVDHFKRFNDSYGHDVGDQVLKMVAQMMKKHSRPGTAYRYGGEEFAIIFPGAAAADVRGIADQLRTRIGSYPFALRKFLRPYFPPEPSTSAERGKRRKRPRIKDAPKSIHITVSIGLAGRDGTDLNPEQTLKLADKALYAAKEAGRNRLAMYNPGGQS